MQIKRQQLHPSNKLGYSTQPQSGINSANVSRRTSQKSVKATFANVNASQQVNIHH